MSFDLKGSSKGRETKFARKDQYWWRYGFLGNPKIMKDNNFIQIKHDFHGGLLDFDERLIRKYSKAIAADSMFLRNHNLIDYSLLLVIESLDKPSNSIVESNGSLFGDFNVISKKKEKQIKKKTEKVENPYRLSFDFSNTGKIIQTDPRMDS